MNTIFGHVATLISNREEVATKALHCILTRSPAACAVMQEIARVGNSAIPQIAGYHVWPSSRSGEGKPDIRGVSGNKQDLLLIECKLWAGLTEHQPVTYLNRLPQDGVLLFIVPEQRRLSLAMKLEQKLVNSQIATGNWVEAGTIKVLFGEPSTGGNPYP